MKAKLTRVDTIKSLYDPTRNTVGAIYRDAQLNNTESYVINGDLTNELMGSLVEDINTTVASDPFKGEAFFLSVHESKDLMMPKAIRRRMIVSKKRPFPEDDLIVFFVDPKSATVEFCWCLPHWTEMDNMLMNEHQFNKEMIEDIKAWKSSDWGHFGIVKIDGKLKALPYFKNRKLKKSKSVVG